jgi:hypothetical protein
MQHQTFITFFKGISIARKPSEEKVIAFADETTVLMWEEFSVHEP